MLMNGDWEGLAENAGKSREQKMEDGTINLIISVVTAICFFTFCTLAVVVRCAYSNKYKSKATMSNCCEACGCCSCMEIWCCAHCAIGQMGRTLELNGEPVNLCQCQLKSVPPQNKKSNTVQLTHQFSLRVHSECNPNPYPGDILFF